MLDSVRMQMSVFVRRKSSVCVYLLLLVFVIINFLINVISNLKIQYVTQMPDYAKMLVLSDWSVAGRLLMEFYPLLVIIPTSCAYLTDRDSGIGTYIRSRTGGRKYWYGKLIAVFAVTFVIFTLPFFLESVLGVLSFSPDSRGDSSGFNFFSTAEEEKYYFLSSLYARSRFLYVTVNILLFGVISGIFAVFNCSVTAIFNFKYKAFAYFPIFVILVLLSVAGRISGVGFTDYFSVIKMFGTESKDYYFWLLFLIMIAVLSVIFTEFRIRKEDMR